MTPTFHGLAASWCLSTALTVFAEPNQHQDTPPKTTIPERPVELTLDRNAPRPLIDVHVNGRGPFRFVLDTGAAGLVLFKDLADELKLNVVGEAGIGDPSNPEAIKVDRVRIDELRVGEVVVSGVEASSWDAPAPIRRLGADVRGIFGLVLLSECLVTFDFERGRLILERGALGPVDEKEILTLSPPANPRGLPEVRLRVADQFLMAHIDTGSPDWITLPERLKDNLALKSPASVVARARTANSEFDVLEATLSTDIQLGSRTFHEPTVRFVSMLNESGHANLGKKFLQDYRMTIDQKNSRIRFAPAGNADNEHLKSP